MQIGILDFGNIRKNSNGIEAIHETISNAQLAERLGFSRYWLTEHYLDGLAWRNPELIINLIAGYTDTIKVGAAGVIVDLNLPFRIAQDYALLANLFPQRVDLGFAKGGANGDKRIQLTNHIKSSSYFEGILEIKKFLENKNEYLSVTPPNGLNPELWILGTSNTNSHFAIEQQMNFSLSLFHGVDGKLPSPIIIDNFKKCFFEKNGYVPNVNIAISMFCSTNNAKILNERASNKNITLNISGFPEECLFELEKVGRQYDTNEIIVLNMGTELIDRNLLMEVLGSVCINA